MALSLQTVKTWLSVLRLIQVPLAVVLVALHLAAVFKVVAHSTGADRHDPWQRAGSNSIFVMFMVQVAVDVAALLLVGWLGYAWVEFMRSPVWPAQLATAGMLYEQRTTFAWRDCAVPWDGVILGYLCLQLLLLLVARLWLMSLLVLLAVASFVCTGACWPQPWGLSCQVKQLACRSGGGDVHTPTDYQPPSRAAAEGPVGPAEFEASPLVLTVPSSQRLQ